MSGFSGSGCAPFLFSFILLLSSSVSGYEWHATGGRQEWKTHNILSSQFTADGILFYGNPDSPDFRILFPEGLFNDGSHVSIRLRTMSIASSVQCNFISRGNIIATQKLSIYGGKSWKEYSFVLSNAEGTDAPIDSIALDFSDAKYVEIRDVTIQGPSFSELFIIKGLRPSDVNALYPFTLYGYPMTVLLYAIAVLAGLGILFYSVINKKRAALAMVCMPLIAVYFIHDIREDLEEFVIMKTHYEDYIDSTSGEKRLFWNDAKVEFADFIRRNADPGDTAVHVFGDDDDYTYFKYLLYPWKVEQGKRFLKDVNIFCAVRNAGLEGNKLVLDGNVLFDHGRGFAFNSYYLLYMTR